MEIWQILVLGIIQGASEFLPISSTAHLVLAPYFFNFPDLGLAFDVALHLGTLLAVVIFFWGEWQGILKNRKLVTLLALATLPGFLFGFLLEEQAGTAFRTPLFIAFNLAVFGLILGAVDTWGKKLNDLGKLDQKGALLVGFCQALAILPGVSRSGMTMTGGLILGLKREAAVRFSFLLSAPIIFGSVAWEGRKLLGGGWYNYQQLDKPRYFEAQYNTAPELWLLGVLVSFVSGLLAIKFLLGFVKNHSLWPFVVYRFVLALIIVLTLLARSWPERW